MTSIGSQGGMLPPPGTVPWRTRWMDHVMLMPYRTGKQHIYFRHGRWRVAAKKWTWEAPSWNELLREWGR